jgi:hypothetical protein
MALLAPLRGMAKNFECPYSASSPADPKLYVRTLTKCHSLNSLLTLHKLHTQLNFFGFNLLDLLNKLMKIMLLYILYILYPKFFGEISIQPASSEDKDDL